MPANDYYSILGVSRNASQDEIRKAFKKIARESHPDVKPGDKSAAERFKQAAEAYEVLGDAENRKKYDQFGPAWKQASQFGGGGPGGSEEGPFRRGGPVDIDLRDLFGGGGAVDLESLFGGMFGGGGGGGSTRTGQRRPRSAKGQDVTAAITVPFHLAALGGEYDLTLQRGGAMERLSVRIPAGVRDGGTIRLSGKGEPGVGGGPAGDLLVTVHVDPHPYFKREGDDLTVEVPVTIAEACLGAKVDVPTLSDGQLTVTIPPGTSSGAKLRLRGKGITNPKTRMPGDQYVQIKIVAPANLSSEARELLQRLDEEAPYQPRLGLW